MKPWRPKDKPIGRPFGTFGEYKPPKIKKTNVQVYLENWLAKKLRAKKFKEGSMHDYMEELILKDNPSWRPK